MTHGEAMRAFAVELGAAIAETPEVTSIVVLYQRGDGWSVSVCGRQGCLGVELAQAIDCLTRLLSDRIRMMRIV